ncbi:MAG TPA: protein translocase subunit SecD [Candidatus Krumholzibacteria bacterium]|nr:protein translocase subunit SecD [Candidatus Krumholzibacteria bacterium]HRX50854.1 protein translocase subunit SecD [Candidatus Krumholzibacteria bacterium]
MNRSLTVRALLVIAVVAASLIGLWPTYKASRITDEMREAALTDPKLASKIESWETRAIRRGLDLEGGMYIVLEIDTEGLTQAQASDAMARVTEILRNRVDQFGVSEPEIKPLGNKRIIVQLPGLDDPERARNLIGSTARLEFRMVRPVDDVQMVLDKLDDAFRITAAVETSAPAETPAADAAAEEAVAAADGAAETVDPNETLALDDLPGQPGASEDPQLGDPERPFSGYLYADAAFSQMWGTPLAVDAAYVAKVQQMLDAPEMRVMPRGMEFQLGMDDVNVGGGTVVRPLYLLDSKAGLTGERLTGARAAPDQDRPGSFVVTFNLDRRGAREFSQLTAENVGRNMAIALDGKVNSAPRINGKIPGGAGEIQGGFSSVEANDLALLLRAGALPVDVSIEEERTVGPSLGRDSIKQGLKAGLYGLIVVVVFVLIYYQATGAVAVLALAVNLIILMAVLAQFGLVLTLPGIAGIILTIGMAVDANVLINERIREELDRGKTARAAVDSGYGNATRTIVDANVTTLIAAAILWWFGTGPIQGFAVTLTIGIFSSMFTALVLTRVIMEAATRNRAQAKLSI